MDSASREDYLKAVYCIQSGKNRAARPGEIAKALGVSLPSVSEMVRKLKAAGLVEFRKNRGVSLSKRGISEATEAVRKHRLLEVFFHRVLNLTGVAFHREADRVEHSLSGDASKRLEAFLKHPKKCPDGNPIPGRTSALTLDSAPVSSDLRVLFSSLDSSRDLVQRLNALGLVPGANLRILRRVRNGPVILLLKGGELALGRDICANIYVEACSGLP